MIRVKESVKAWVDERVDWVQVRSLSYDLYLGISLVAESASILSKRALSWAVNTAKKHPTLPDTNSMAFSMYSMAWPIITIIPLVLMSFLWFKPALNLRHNLDKVAAGFKVHEKYKDYNAEGPFAAFNKARDEELEKAPKPAKVFTSAEEKKISAATEAAKAFYAERDKKLAAEKAYKEAIKAAAAVFEEALNPAEKGKDSGKTGPIPATKPGKTDKKSPEKPTKPAETTANPSKTPLNPEKIKK